MTKNDRLYSTLSAVCPVDGVSILAAGGVRIDYGSAATAPQKAAAQAAVASFDWSDAAQAAWEALQNPEKDGLTKAAAAAIQTNTDFLAIASPTNAQTLAQVKALTQQNTRIIKRLIQLTG